MARISKRVLVTRQLEQANSFVNALSDRGHFAYLLPMIETVQLCPAIADGIYEVILFTSANAVKHFAPYNERVRGLVYIAVGPKTAQAMQIYLGVSADRVPVVYDMENVQRLLSSMRLTGARILSPGAEVRTEIPSEELSEMGASLLTPAVYETNYADYPKGYVDQFLNEHKIQTITLCSPSAAKSFLSQLSGDISAFDVISIGSTTSDYLESVGINSRYPSKFTVEAMADIV